MVDEKVCSHCKELLPASRFAPDKRRPTGLQSKCRKCATSLYNTPAHKAAARRRANPDMREYVTQDVISANAAEKRRLFEESQRPIIEARQAELDLKRANDNLARAKYETANTIGSDEWHLNASADQILSYHQAMDLKANREANGSGQVRRIKLGGRQAVGDYEYVTVDAEDYERLSRYSWKAKVSSSHVYAVRNAVVDGLNITIRMHRDVLGMSGHNGIDVDHINGDTMINTTRNLRPATRMQNVHNTDAKRSLLAA